nr:putative late blight resistance protein homolog R1A-3 [Ipomoea batatas]
MVSTLKDKLHFLHAYLHKSNPYLDEAVKRVDEEIRDVAIKAEDEIESKLGEIYQLQGEGEGVAVKACEDLHRSLQQVVKDFESVELQNVRDGVSSSNYDLENTILGIEGSVCNSQLFKLQSLQTLILSAWTKEYQLQLPCDVLDLSWLRHVQFDKGSSCYLPNLVQENLQTLSWFKVTGRDSRTTNFTKVPNLKELGMYIEGEVLSNALDSLAQLHQLEKLKVLVGRVERFNLPNSFPPNLKQLTLSNTYLSWEDMSIIGKLSNLDLLKLKDFACCGSEWKPGDGGFLQLRFFLIERSDLEHWNANANHFPVLERLVLRYCWDLKKLPNDFEELYTLRLIELDNCCSSLVISTMEIQKWQRESGNEALVVRDITKVELPTNESSGNHKQVTMMHCTGFPEMHPSWLKLWSAHLLVCYHKDVSLG